MTVEVPPGLEQTLARIDPASAPWLEQLPELAAGYLRRWRLRLDGPVMHGWCAMVLPVRTAEGDNAVLKLSWPHEEAREEHRALAVWNGVGAVRLLAVDASGFVMLLERLHADRDLTTEPLEAALRRTGELLARLGVAVDDSFVLVEESARRWAAELAAARREPPVGVPQRMLDRAAVLLGDLLAESASVLLHTDLHYYNVLAGEREPWLAIDPKPLVGDPAYEIAPLLWNRWPEATASADLAGHLRWRADVVAEPLGLDRATVAGWVTVRESVEVLDAVRNGDDPGREQAIEIADAFRPRLD